LNHSVFDADSTRSHVTAANVPSARATLLLSVFHFQAPGSCPLDYLDALCEREVHGRGAIATVGRGAMRWWQSGVYSHTGVAKWDEVSYSIAPKEKEPVFRGAPSGDVGREDAMFLGEYQHTLDKKGRVSLPARFRAEAPGKLIISKGLDDCLWVFPADDYAEFLERIMDSDDFKQGTRKVKRHFLAGAVEAELDSAGRISLPPALREHASLVKDVAITGSGNRMEIWDAKNWAAYSEDAADNIENYTEELADTSLP